MEGGQDNFSRAISRHKVYYGTHAASMFNFSLLPLIRFFILSFRLHGKFHGYFVGPRGTDGVSNIASSNVVTDGSTALKLPRH